MTGIADTHSWMEHYGWIRTVVRSRLRDPAAVDDVMQEIAMACLKGISQVRDPSRLGPWLYRVAIRQVLQYRRAAGRRRAFQERYAAEAAPSEVQQQDALQWLLNSETGQLTRQAVERLPELDAQMFFLKYEHQLSYRDIAERLGISRNAVESRLHRIRKQLRRELCRQGIASESSGRATSKAGAD